MKYDDFVGQVQNRAHLGSSGEAVQAIRATLATLSTRLPEEEARHLAAQLPREIGHYLEEEGELYEKISLDEFFDQVSEREGTGLNTAVYHARAVVDVLCEAVSAGEVEKVKHVLPREFAPLFESGSEGEMKG